VPVITDGRFQRRLDRGHASGTWDPKHWLAVRLEDYVMVKNIAIVIDRNTLEGQISLGCG
jgi:hypothetical protein